ncbi:MAG TPA: glycoside hydrolase family 38 C-terminal domain-containing protein [Candidatus Limnocylindria bacterium]|nr:glycoside hydrolase family 38 C-terminal domain-containing protein [Candidatus Limnocylindria bacterium]
MAEAPAAAGRRRAAAASPDGRAKDPKARTVHMVGNAHIDAVWLWQWQEAFAEVKATFRSALDRMREYPDFVFTSSSAAYYWRLEGHDPEMFEEIRQRVGEGRWVICGGWWVQPDCNIPSGESFARHGLYSQRYFREKLGTVATVGYNPDAFGHAGSLPQILRRQGMDGYVFLRPEPHEKGLPARTFWWEAADGSRVLAYRIPHGYASGGGDLERVVRRCLPELKDPIDEIMVFYGVGNHGGGPTRANIESIGHMDADPGFPHLVPSSPPAYFASIREKPLAFPVVHDELQYHAKGCYAAHSGVKRWNRRAEHLLAVAEAYATIADAVAGQPFPEVFPQAWRAVLFNQFHDILAGSSVEPAYDDARDLYGEAMSLAGRALNNAIQSISWKVDLPAPEGAAGEPAWAAGEAPVVVFNPHAWSGPVPVEVEFGSLGTVVGLVDDEGREVPVQVGQSLAAVGDSRKRLVFVADLPSLGYRSFRVRLEHAGESRTPAAAASPTPGPAASTDPAVDSTVASESAAAVEEAEERAEHVLENDRLRVALDPVTGFLASIFDRQADFEILRGQAARAIVVDDPSDTWGHGMQSLDREIGAFEPESMRRIEDGPVRSAIRVESRWQGSRLRQDFIVYRDVPLLYVEATLDWHERHRALKLRFPADLLVPRATYEIPYGTIERPTDGTEQPGQRWLDLTGLRPDRRSIYGVALLNDSKYSFDVRAERHRGNYHYAEIGMTVVRSPIYAHHDPYEPRPDLQYAYMDQGLQRFAYALLPHEGGWEEARVVQRAAELNQRPIAVVETFHPGPLPRSASYAEVDADNVMLTVLKRAEDDDDIVIRLWEVTGAATTATLRLPAWRRELRVELGPAEIRTLKVPRDPARPAREVDLIEWEDTTAS